MMDYPKTKVAARRYRYRVWAGEPKGRAYDERMCAYKVHDEGRGCLFHQCERKPGKGPDGLYCGIHAKMVTK